MHSADICKHQLTDLRQCVYIRNNKKTVYINLSINDSDWMKSERKEGMKNTKHQKTKNRINKNSFNIKY